MKKTVFSFAYFFLLLALITGCSVGGDPAPQMPQSALLFATLSPDAAPANIQLNGNNVAEDMPYDKFVPYYLTPAGNNTLKITFAGNSSTINSTLTTGASKYYSVFLIDSASKIKTAVVEDNLATVSPDSVRIRFFNFSPNAPAVDVAITGGSTVFFHRSFNDQSILTTYNQFIPFKKGIYNIEIKDAASSATILTIPDKELIGGGVYTLFLKGFVGGTADKALGLENIKHL